MAVDHILNLGPGYDGMGTKRTVYMCLTCFEVSGSLARHHGRGMVACDVGEPGDAGRKPRMDASGRLTSHAPQWYLEAARRGAPRPHLEI